MIKPETMGSISFESGRSISSRILDQTWLPAQLTSVFPHFDDPVPVEGSSSPTSLKNLPPDPVKISPLDIWVPPDSTSIDNSVVDLQKILE